MVRREADPIKFWRYVALFAFGALFGPFMILVGGVGIGVGLGIFE
jgi:hypothetical protein